MKFREFGKILIDFANSAEILGILRSPAISEILCTLELEVVAPSGGSGGGVANNPEEFPDQEGNKTLKNKFFAQIWT